MALTFKAVPVEVARERISNTATKASEPRDTVERILVQPFLASGEEQGWAGINEDGTPFGFTWQMFAGDEDAKVMTDKVQDKHNPESDPDGPNVRTIAKIINQQNNRKRWHVFAKVLKVDGGELELILINEKMESERLKAEREAKANAKANANAKESAKA